MSVYQPIRQAKQAGHSQAVPKHESEAAEKEHAALMALVPESSVTHVATKSGSWFDPKTWQGGVVPSDGANVLISRGVRVTYNQQSETRLKTVRLDGILEFAHNKNTKMVVDTFVNRHCCMNARYEVAA
jgi:hypothetical protein